MENVIRIESRWSDHGLDWFQAEFASLANLVFGPFVTTGYCKAMFDNNIHGPSLITVAYVDGQPAGVDVMWRNDLNGVEAYQTVNTCVLEPYRGMGLFKKMTHYELELLGNDTLVYGFPNANSYPGYVKMGWHVGLLHAALFSRNKCTDVDGAYATWWLQAQKGITYIRRQGDCYLIRKKSNRPLAVVIGRVDDAVARLFPKHIGPCLLKCFETKSSSYNKNKTIPFVCNQPQMEIPYWKIDAI